MAVSSCKRSVVGHVERSYATSRDGYIFYMCEISYHGDEARILDKPLSPLSGLAKSIAFY